MHDLGIPLFMIALALIVICVVMIRIARILDEIRRLHAQIANQGRYMTRDRS